MGNASELNDISNGDLVVKVIVEESEIFKRSNDDVHVNLDISLLDAIFGCKKDIETLDKSKLKVEIKPGCQSEEKIVLKNLVKYFN